MRRTFSAAAVLAAFLAAGCDEQKQSPRTTDASEPPAAPTPEKKRAVRDAGLPPPAEEELPPAAAQAQEAAAPAGKTQADPGRVTFDGDRKREDSVTPPSAVFAGLAAAPAKPKVAYTQAGRGDTLSVKEPPAPGAASEKGKDFQIASAKVGSNSSFGPAKGAGDSSASKIPAETASGSCPAGMALVETACVDKYEASLEGGKAVSRAGVKPRGYISGDQAAGACAQAGKRLCTMKEWVKACQGPQKTQYPYGASYEPGACNEFDHKNHAGHVSAMHRLFGPNASFDYKTMNDPRLDEMPDTVAPSGSFSKCANGYGVYDMVGNLHEWVSDKAGAKGVFKGGYFEDTHLNGDGCRYTTTAHEPSYHDYSTGFRCCADPS